MSRGLAMWTMSKIVMLIFLFTVMGSMLYYQEWMRQTSRINQAQSVAMEIREGFNRILLPESLESRAAVPIPYRIAGQEYYFMISTATTSSGQKILYIVLAYGSHDNGFFGPWDAAASLIVSPETEFSNGETGKSLEDSPVQGSSLTYRFIMIDKVIDPAGHAAVTVQACERLDVNGECA